MKNLPFVIVVAFMISLSFSCEELFYVPLSIIAFSPDRECCRPGEEPEIWVEFSTEVEHARTEQAFHLNSGSRDVEGRFLWHEKRLGYAPFEALKTGTQYTMRVDASVEDLAGNSMREEFVFRFRIGVDAARPLIMDAFPETAAVDCVPYQNATLGAQLPDDLFHSVTIVFSEAVEKASFYEAFSITPGVAGSFSWPTPETAVFSPAEPYDWQTEYAVALTTELKDMSGNELAEEYVTRFYAGTDRTAPLIVSVCGIPPEPALQGEEPVFLVQDSTVTSFEANWSLLVLFDEPVDKESVEKSICFTPEWDHRIDYDPQLPDRVFLRPAEEKRFAYGKTYRFTINPGVSDRQGNKTVQSWTGHFLVNGGFTLPPSVVRLCYLDDVDSGFSPQILEPLQTIAVPNPPGTSSGLKTAVFDFYFSLSENAVIPIASFLENMDFVIENACVTPPDYQDVEMFVFGDEVSGPPLGVPLGPHEEVIRLYLQIADNATQGTITITIGEDLVDESNGNSQRHNTMTDDFSIRLRDPD